MPKCLECDKAARKLKDDPRDPFLEEGPCLCNDCHESVVVDLIEELECKIAELKLSIGVST